MGNENSLDKGMRMYAKQEFERVRGNNDRKYLKVSEVIKLQHPENYPFNLTHLGTLYVLDNEHNGQITLSSLIGFGNFCAANLRNVQAYEFQAQLQGLATSLLWDAMIKKGPNYVLQWLEKLLLSNEDSVHHSKEGIKFLRIDTVKVMYEIFNLRVMSSVDIQQFFDLLQQSGEESGLMALDCEELDEFVPVSVCLDFARDFLKGFKKLMIEVGLDE